VGEWTMSSCGRVDHVVSKLADGRCLEGRRQRASRTARVLALAMAALWGGHVDENVYRPALLRGTPDGITPRRAAWSQDAETPPADRAMVEWRGFQRENGGAARYGGTTIGLLHGFDLDLGRRSPRASSHRRIVFSKVPGELESPSLYQVACLLSTTLRSREFRPRATSRSAS
jgi:hypothetical protein